MGVQRLLPLAALLLLFASNLFAADKTATQTGTLVDLQMVQSAKGYVRAGQSYCLAVSLGDFGYLLHYGPIWAYGYAPSEMIVGDPIQVRIKGNNMYLQKPRGGELRTSIIRRERIAADKKPITCALPVATGD
jgi:hypothetical protein